MKKSSSFERVSLVDANGVIQKLSVLRSEIDQYPGLHLQIVIGVFLNTHGEVLVHKRAQCKKVNPGDIDHVCGAVMSCETTEQAILRETEEETGIIPKSLKLVTKGLNTHGRYRYLYSGTADGRPVVDETEADWVKFIHPNLLKQGFDNGEMSLVDEFFEDMETVLKNC